MSSPKSASLLKNGLICMASGLRSGCLKKTGSLGDEPLTERGAPMTPKAFHALFGRIGAWAKMPFPIRPHMLRHGYGYALANAGHDTRALQAWLGHKNIQHTVRYTELAPDRFKNFWR
jgi:site-specific recombinase XerD